MAQIMKDDQHPNLEMVFQYQEKKLRDFVPRLYANSPFYRRKLDEAGVDPHGVRSMEDLGRLPFTTKSELRTGYPLGLMAVTEDHIVRIHSSSGTTGKPVIVPYTARDVSTWAEMMARCLAAAGVTGRDRVQVTPGYGLWTAGIGFQAGVERLGAMAIPTGPGNTEKQIEMMLDLRATVLSAPPPTACCWPRKYTGGKSGTGSLCAGGSSDPSAGGRRCGPASGTFWA